MIIYEITANVRLNLIEDYERFMCEVHTNDLLATGHFKSAEMARVTDGVYRIRYLAEDRKALERYFETDVKRLRADFTEKFPEGVDISREILEVIEVWQP